MRAQRRKKMFAINFYGGKCIKCGYDKCIYALEFHHRDKSTKEANPTYIIMRWWWEKVKEELDKCDLLCANCHREADFKELDCEFQNGIGTRAAE